MNDKVKSPIWLLSSTKREIEPLVEWFNTVSSRAFYGQHLWEVMDAKGRTFVIATTGIGKTNAAFTVGALSQIAEKPDVILNVGIAGAYSYAPPVMGDVVVVTKCLMGDEGVWEAYDRFLSYEPIGISPADCIKDAIRGFISIDDSSLLRQIKEKLPAGHYSSEKILPRRNRRSHSEEINRPFNLWYGPSCSVGLVSGSTQIALMRYKNYGAWIEEMEVSAIWLASLRLGVPAIAIRGVSNTAGERDRSRWEMDRAIHNACAITLRVLQEI